VSTIKQIVLYFVIIFILSVLMIQPGLTLNNDIMISFTELQSLDLDERELDVDEQIYSGGFTNNGTSICLFGSKKLFIFDAATGRNIRNITIREDVDDSGPVALSNDGKYAAIRSYKRSNIYVWDIEKAQIISTISAGKFGERCIVISPDAKIIGGTTVDWDKDFSKFSLWDIETKKEIKEIDRSSDFKYYTDKILFSPNGKTIVIIKDKLVEFWEVSTSEKFFSFESRNTLNTFALSPDNKTIAVATLNGIEIWDYKAKIKISHLGDDDVRALTFTQNGYLFACGHDYRLWYIETRDVLARLDKYRSAPIYMLSGPNGEIVTIQPSIILDPAYYVAILQSVYDPKKEELETINEFRARVDKTRKELDLAKTSAKKYLLSKNFPVKIPIVLGQYSADAEEFSVTYLSRNSSIKVSRDKAKEFMDSRDARGKFFMEGNLKFVDNNNFKIVDPVLLDSRNNIRIPIQTN